MSDKDERVKRGLEVMDQVYGPGFADTMPPVENPLAEDVVAHLFGEVWSRPGLSIRDRRLIVIGATAALGRGDLVEVQVRGALANEELTADQLREMPLQLQYYVGVGNAGVVSGAIERALRNPAPQQPGN